MIDTPFGPIVGWDGYPCDAEAPSAYIGPDRTTIVCRCMICARCGHHTGNNTQGHWWSFCSITGTFRGHHLCCPDDCELEEQDGRVSS
jgi:hypothetical protein